MTYRPNRSDSYQHILLEVSVSDDFMSSFSNANSISHHLDPFQYNEEEFLIRDQLKVEFWKLAKEVCTERQYLVLKLASDGYTQQDIAKMFNVNQSSITKCLNGNVDYNNGSKVYGGVRKKLRRHIDASPVFQKLFNRLLELNEEKL